jgi:lipopolysaccharide/colanic/teichoic acid biosynthesis glycosyltransferase
MKRTIDVVGSATALVVLAPVLLAIGLVVAWRLGRPVLFRQWRPGMHGQPFRLIKFRTMREAFDDHGRPLPDHLRLTRFGAFLRATSLDELPELWNVLKGEMSLVGPRPLMMHYLPHYDAEQRRRHEVKPGLTGWAQVNGRNALDWKDKFRHDVWYVDHHNIWLDFKIMLITLGQVIRAHGIQQDGHATMPPFVPPGTDPPDCAARRPFKGPL